MQNRSVVQLIITKDKICVKCKYFNKRKVTL